MGLFLNNFTFMLQLVLALPVFTSGIKYRWRQSIAIPPAAVLACGLVNVKLTAGLYLGDGSLPGDAMANTGRAVLYYIVYALLLITVVSATYQTDLIEAVVIAAACNTLQHLFYSVFNILFLLLFPRMPIEIFLRKTGSVFIQTAYYLLAYLCAYLLFGRRIHLRRTQAAHEVGWIFLAIAMLFCSILLNLIFNTSDTPTFRIACHSYELICNVLTIAILIISSYYDRSREEMRLMQLVWNQKREQYEFTRENMELINMKCHDIRKVLSHAGSANSNQDKVSFTSSALKEIGDSIRIYDRSWQTGCDALDVVLSEDSLLCEGNHIRFTCMADGRRMGFMDPADIYSLFTNIMDNAMECVQNIAEPQRRVISLTVNCMENLLTIQEENYFDHRQPISFQDGLPLTSKEDHDNHGFGTRSIRYVAEKYGGYASFRTEEDQFLVSIIIPIVEKQSPQKTKA